MSVYLHMYEGKHSSSSSSSYLFYSAATQTEGALPPSWPIRTPRGMNDCPSQWTNLALCPLTPRWLLSGSTQAGNKDKLKLESSCSDCIWREIFAQGNIICSQVAVSFSGPTPIFTLVSGNVGLVPELGRVLNKLHSVVFTAKVCEAQSKALH